jgi:Bacterial extracellular solute-binding proteins, family 5 Middle
MMIDSIEAPDPSTIVFRLKFATAAFLPALADPFSFIYEKAKLDEDPRWYEKNILGSGPFKFPDARLREARAGYSGARDIPALVLPDCSFPLVCEGLEDQPQPLTESGFGDDLARQ